MSLLTFGFSRKKRVDDTEECDGETLRTPAKLRRCDSVVEAVKAAESKAGPGEGDKDIMAQLDEEIDDPTTTEDSPTIAYIKKTFKKRECTSFVPHQEKRDLCRCGYEKNDPKHISKNKIKWFVDTCTKTSETDAYGIVEFPAYGQKTSKYIRVDYKTNVSDLWKLIKEYWQMGTPRLLISVTGGAQRLSTETSLKSALKEVFRNGLIDAAQSTGAWFITGGTNTGVMKMVGDAIRAHTLKHGSRNQLIAIGIATWGCITNKEALIVGKQAMYEVAEPKEGQKEAPLDPNHTHFILVDNGEKHVYGDEIQLRAALEKEISNTEECGVKIPIVCIVIEGGKNTVKTARQAIEVKTPVIIVEGSGRAADVLAYAYRHFTEPKEGEQDQQTRRSVEEANERLWKKLETDIIGNTFKQELGKEDFKGIIDNIKYCLDHYNMLTIFPLEGKGSASGIDYAIIMTLLRVKEGATSTADKMKLALAWDRIDVVKEHIYTDEAKLSPEELRDLAFTAIVNNRVEFVKFFLERRLRLSDLLMNHNINKFYTEAVTGNKHLENALRSVDAENLEDPELNELNKFIRKLADQLIDLSLNKGKVPRRQLPQRLSLRTVTYWYVKKSTTDYEAMQLFVWAILGRLQSMATVFLYEAKETFALSLIGHLMMKNLQNMEQESSETAQDLQKEVDFFEGLTTELLTECYSSNQEMTIDLLVRPVRTFANLTPLEIAVQANNQSVISHEACQNLLTSIWMGRISDDNPSYRTILLPIPPLFLLSPLLLNFREENQEDQSETAINSHDGGASAARSKENPFCRYCKRLGYFLTAPCVKFTFNCVSYIVFLLLYSILLLTNFYPKISSEEIVLIIWIVTIVCEEIRQLVESRDAGRRKFFNYLSNKWNWVDLLAVTTFVVGLVLRLAPSSSCGRCFFAARIVLAFSLLTFYFRILHMFCLFRHLGPKLAMIGEMMIDLFYFMTIFMVFIIAYGIAASVILYPNQELRLRLVPDVLSGAWWSVYGEFNIEEVSGESCEASATQTSSPEDCASIDSDDFNRTLCPGKEEKCPSINWFGPIFLAIYALITNVLMINLLIAMFSNTFAKVEGIADVIWKTQRYHLVREYASHPVLPPPLIVVEHVFRLILAIVHKLKNQKKNAKQSGKSRNRTFTMEFDGYHERDLIAWLKANVEEYLLKKESEGPASDRLAKETSDRIDQLYRRIEESEHTRKSLDEKMSELIKLLSQKI